MSLIVLFLFYFIFVPERTLAQTGPLIHLELCWNIIYFYIIYLFILILYTYTERYTRQVTMGKESIGNYYLLPFPMYTKITRGNLSGSGVIVNLILVLD